MNDIFEFPTFENLYKMVFTNFILFVSKELGFLAVKLKKPLKMTS